MELDNVSGLLEESETKGVKLAKEVDKLGSKLQDLEVRGLQPWRAKGHPSFKHSRFYIKKT